MVEIQIDYRGQLRCRSEHMPSSAELETDAPVDNHGLGQSFSPTDLVATGLGSCMATVMGIAAQRKEIDLMGLKIVVQKEMSADLPRRISRLPIEITMPLPEDHQDAQLLINTALSCPVHQSIHPDIEVPITWIWKG